MFRQLRIEVARVVGDIVAKEVDNLKAMGVKFEMNTLVGRTTSVQQILTDKGFDAAFIGTGAGLPKFFGIPGENYIGVGNLALGFAVGDDPKPAPRKEDYIVFDE